jgi:hypothetical protein
MVSQIKVNEIIKQSGSTITIGETNDTITLPSTATLTNFPAMTPAFQANNPQNGSVANNTQVKLSFNTELFDTDSCYDTSTYNFTPTTAGKYFVYASARWQTSTNTATRLDLQIYKNSSGVLSGRNNNTDYSIVACAGIVDMNGSSDTLSVYSYQNTGNTTAISTESIYTYFGAYKVIGA